MSIKRKMAEFILDHRLAIILAVIVITALLVFPLSLFRISNNVLEDLPEDDLDVIYYKEFREMFRDPEMVIIGLQADDIFTDEVLLYIKKLTELIEEVEGVEEVTSLTNIPELKADGDMLGEDFLEEIPLSSGELEQKKKQALSNELWVRNIVSEDGTAAAINVMLPSVTDGAASRFRVLSTVKRILEQDPQPGVKVFVTGISPLMSDAIDFVRADFKCFMRLTPVLIILLLFFVFRTFRGMTIPLIIILAAVVWTLGLFFTAGKAVGMATAILPTLIAVICLSDVIHIIAHYYELAAKSTDKREVLAATMEHMIPACFLTSLTTAVGFGSLAASPIRCVKDFGIWSAVGIMIAWLLATTVVPIVLSILPLPNARVQKRYDRSLPVWLIGRLVKFVERDRVWIPVIAVVIVALSIFGIGRLKIETQISTYLPESAPSIQGLIFIQDKMSPFSTLEMTIEGPPGVFKEEWGFEEVRKIQRFLGSLPGVDKVVSFANFIREFDRDIFLLETTDRFDSFLSSDYSTARISARIQPTSTAGQLELLSKVEESAPKELDKRLRFRTTGAAKLYATKATALINGQVRSLGFSMAVITLLLILYLRSIRVGLLSMIPNVLPVLMTLGMMGLSGISLNLSTVMISCIAIAIAVDDTIHFLVRYRREILTNGRVTPAIERTMFESGRAMVFTSLVIAGGFSILLFSSFAPIEYFGLLTAFTMITALGADLLVLPFLIKLFKVMQRVVESDEARQDGRAHSYLGTSATLHSPPLGGKRDVRRKPFERVIETSTSSEGRG